MSKIDILLNENTDPFDVFGSWFAEARNHELNDPNAMALSTVDSKGRISSRMVLLKDHNDKGFVFYTNAQSDKGKALKENPNAALLFYWKSLHRQIRIEGSLSLVTKEEADAYFTIRPHTSKLGAWASQQSRVLESRMIFTKQMAIYAKKFTLKEVPRPPHWVGFRLAPLRIEFWQDGKFRLHDRIILTRRTISSSKWARKRLYP